MSNKTENTTFGTAISALVAVQREMGGVVAAMATNNYTGSKYATLDLVLKKAIPILSQNGFAVLVQTTATEGGKIEVMTSLWHESGEAFSIAIPMPTGKGSAQDVGGAVTYGRRYGLCSLLAVSHGEDEDGNDLYRSHKQAVEDGDPDATRFEELREARDQSQNPRLKAVLSRIAGKGTDLDKASDWVKSQFKGDELAFLLDFIQKQRG